MMGKCQDCEHFIHRMVGKRGGIRGVCELSCTAIYFWNSRRLTDSGTQRGCSSKFVDRKAPCKYADGCEGEWECLAYGIVDCPHTDIDYNYFDPSMGAKEINVVNCIKERKMKTGDACFIFRNIKEVDHDENYRTVDIINAVEQVANMETHNSITKAEMLEVIKWLVNYIKE